MWIDGGKINNICVPADAMKNLIEPHKMRYYMFLLTSLGSRYNYMQLFYYTLWLEYKGMSRTDIELMSQMGSALPISSCDRPEKSIATHPFDKTGN